MSISLHKPKYQTATEAEEEEEANDEQVWLLEEAAPSRLPLRHIVMLLCVLVLMLAVALGNVQIASHDMTVISAHCFVIDCSDMLDSVGCDRRIQREHMCCGSLRRANWPQWVELSNSFSLYLSI